MPDDPELLYVLREMRVYALAVARHWPAWIDRDDAVGAAQLAVVQAWARFDASTGVPFKAYVLQRVRGAVIDYHRWVTTRHRYGTHDAPQSLDALTVFYDRPADDDVEAEVCAAETAREVRDFIRAAVAPLDERSRACVFSTYDKDLAVRYGVTESRISQIRKKAFQQIAAALP